MSIAQFDPTVPAGAAVAQPNPVPANGAASADFARMLQTVQAQKQERDHEAQRQAQNATTTGRPDRAAAAHARPVAKANTAAADRQSSTGKPRDARHADRKDAAATDASQQAQQAAPPPPAPPLITTAAASAAAGNSATARSAADPSDGGTSASDGSAPNAATDQAAATDQTATNQTAADTADTAAAAAVGSGSTANTTAIAAGPGQAAATAQAATPAAGAAAQATPAGPTTIGPASLATLAALGTAPGAATAATGSAATAAGRAATATGRAVPSAVPLSVSRAPATVRPALLTTVLPQEVSAAAPAQPQTAAANAGPANEPSTTDDGAPDDQATLPPAPTPADAAPAATELANAFASALGTTVAVDPRAAAGTAEPHPSLFAQGGSDPAGQTLSSGTAPTVAGFATFNAGTTVSRAETAQTPQGGQGSQTPLQLPAEQLAIAISRNAGTDGGQNFTIKLTPEKLGSVEVKLQVDAKGKTTANFIVEHPETLQLLKQDSQQLVQSLQNVGVDANGASLNFSLRDPNMGQAQNQANGSAAGSQNGGTARVAGDAEAADQPAIASNRLYDIKA